MSNTIKVPKPEGTFNPGRLLEKNPLIQAQVKHFHEAEKQLPPSLRTRVNIENILTEGQAGGYIRQVTQAIHKGGGLPEPKVEKAT
jgi:hypothetical protein